MDSGYLWVFRNYYGLLYAFVTARCQLLLQNVSWNNQDHFQSFTQSARRQIALTYAICQL